MSSEMIIVQFPEAEKKADETNIYKGNSTQFYIFCLSGRPNRTVNLFQLQNQMKYYKNTVREQENLQNQDRFNTDMEMINF